MKIKYLFLVCLLIIGNASYAQSPEYLYHLDADFLPTSKSSMTILGYGYKQENSVLIDFFELSNKKMLLTANFTDSTMSMLNGSYQQYHVNGLFAKDGMYAYGKKVGVWQEFDSLSHMIDSSIYQNDKVLLNKHREFDKYGILRNEEIHDSINNTLDVYNFDSTGQLATSIHFKNKLGKRVKYGSTGIIEDSLYNRDKKEAHYPGDVNTWRRYLETHLKIDNVLDNRPKAGTYVVIVKFIVEADGSLSNILAETNHGFGTEQEAIRVIRTSGKWTPSVIYGERVRSYRRQPITFVIRQ